MLNLGPFRSAIYMLAGMIGGLVILIMLSITGHCQTRVRQLPDKTILRRGNFVIAATTDGYLCYGTHDPLETTCHKAVPLPEGPMRESSIKGLIHAAMSALAIVEAGAKIRT
jgi:hypothetical protein